MVVLRALAVVAGSAVVVWTLLSAVRAVILPRGEVVALSRAVFVTLRRVFGLVARPARSYEARDRAMAMYAPVALLALAGSWVVLVTLGFTFVYWGLGVEPLRQAFTESGSSLLTLGFVKPTDLPTTIAAFVEATIGLGLIALLISYLPSIYSAFQRREQAVVLLETRAGAPPDPAVMIKRAHTLARLDLLHETFVQWEVVFADIEETHTSQPSLPFFRSPATGRSWVTASGCVLDSAALMMSVVNQPVDPNAALCLRAGFLSLRRIADYFQIPYDPDPDPDDPISIDRAEFDEVYEDLASFGVPVRPDRERAWRDFQGWRVNYDLPLLGLAGLTMAPYAKWSSDRSVNLALPRVRAALRLRWAKSVDG
ncbi:MAG: hypothetical protein KDB35_11650 [Acidimicrobiales bacterium]|nr:hypothetical protein [Acidimicrobiales bacterium]MCB1015259.1 hypothetical protein [Acidimicrobiales bacterium]MCB9371917.1 hypothetical protein [Microthrixaceae bacterium]